MPLCTVCTHPQRHEIDAALVRREVGYRAVAGRYGLVPVSVWRHMQTHLRDTIRQSKEAQMLASSESLMAELNRLHEYANWALDTAKDAGDTRTVLAGVDVARRNVERLERLGPLGDAVRRLAALEEGNRDDDLGDD
jgi:hypothetical protein